MGQTTPDTPRYVVEKAPGHEDSENFWDVVDTKLKLRVGFYFQGTAEALAQNLNDGYPTFVPVKWTK